MYPVPWRVQIKERKAKGERWSFMDTVRYAYFFGGFPPAALFIVSMMIEPFVKLGALLRWKARLVDLLDGGTFAISAGGYCITLANNLDYFRDSNYMRALSERVPGVVLLSLFSIMGALSMASLLLRNSPRVNRHCEDSPKSRFCWCVYLVFMLNHSFAVFCYAAWAAENNLSVNAYHPGNYAPFTAFFISKALISGLIGISLPWPGKQPESSAATVETPPATVSLPPVRNTVVREAA